MNQQQIKILPILHGSKLHTHSVPYVGEERKKKEENVGKIGTLESSVRLEKP